MKQILPLEHIRWVKITNPTERDVKDIEEEFHIHPLVLKEFFIPTIRPKVEVYENHLYMVMHFPIFNAKERKTHALEIDFVLFKDTIITMSYQDITPLEEFWEMAKKDDGTMEKTAGHFLYYLIHHLFGFAHRELDHIEDNVDTLEDVIFYGRSDIINRDIYIARRDVIDFRRTLKPQEITLEALVHKGADLYGDRVKPFFQRLIAEHQKIRDVVDDHMQTIDELYDTNQSIVSSNINSTMKVFTVLAFITFIPTLIVNLFSVSVAGIPFAHDQNGFWLVLLLALVCTVFAYVVFKLWKIL
ncbi:MAG: CorA family divalent cation transporter [Patescibacteria group bacterium]